MSPSNSIEIAIWVAVGGRGPLIGPVLGAALINGAKSWLTAAVPELWLYALGLLLILVTRFLPGGIAGALVRGPKPGTSIPRADPCCIATAAPAGSTAAWRWTALP